jgi:hypothetical protein
MTNSCDSFRNTLRGPGVGILLIFCCNKTLLHISSHSVCRIFETTSRNFAMPFAVLPALLPDIEKIYDIYFSSFTNDEMGALMVKILFPSGISPEFRKHHTAGTIAYLHQSIFQYTWKCVDMETGDIVGMALGDIYLQERSEEERMNNGVPWLQGEEKERAERILTPLHEVRERLWGNHKYICKRRIQRSYY